MTKRLHETESTFAAWVLPLVALAALLIASPTTALDAAAEDEQQASEELFNQAATGILERLEQANKELAELRKQINDQTIPLSRELNKLESELKEARREFAKVQNTNAARALEKGNLEREIEGRQDTAIYLSNFMDDFIRKFEAGLHVSEVQRYTETIEAAKLIMQNRSFADTPEQRYGPQIEALDMTLTRLEEGLGGTTFKGTAIDPSGKVHNGTYTLLGPVAIFGAADADLVGLIEKSQASNAPSIITFNNPLMAEAAAAFVETGGGDLPLDTTLGNARMIEQTEETFVDQVKAGGPVMIPIGILACLAILLGVLKLITLLFVRKPGRGRLKRLLEAVATKEKANAVEAVAKIPGPSGKMLRAGVEHLGEPRELIEEVMYEHVLSTKLKVNRILPFIAICAAAAPLLGLLGTVSGIINTFNMMKIFDSADMKNVSGGISEALITTQYGLIVAIPALMFHAVLSRMAKGVVDQMEKSGVAFINQVMKTHPGGDGDTSGVSKPKQDPDPIVPDDEPKTEDSNQKADESPSQESPADQEQPEAGREPVMAQAGVTFEGGNQQG